MLLIVEDEPDLREMLSSLCESTLNIEVQTAADGQEALDLIRNLPQNQSITVLSDINMPRMDGITLAKWINDNRKKTNVILMSGYFDNELKVDKAFENIFFFQKPLNFEVLFDEIKNLIKQE